MQGGGMGLIGFYARGAGNSGTGSIDFALSLIAAAPADHACAQGFAVVELFSVAGFTCSQAPLKV
jgi:hypothetical protein